MRCLIPVPVGDLLDRITILELKAARAAPAARVHVEAELAALAAAWSGLGAADPPERVELARVNGALWEIEDELRRHEAAGEFGSAFVAAARQVYQLNDERAALKRALNLRLGSELVEEKVHPDYRRGW